MKHLTNLTMLFLALALSANLMATNYLVTGAGRTDCNGVYEQSGSYNGKPSYFYSSPFYTYSIYYHTEGKWVINDGDPGFSIGIYNVISSSATPPASGWTTTIYGSDPAPTVPVYAGPVQATNVNLTRVSTTMDITWTNGNGNYRVVFVKQTSSGTASPVDYTTYSQSTIFGIGEQIGSTGWYCVYNGTGTSVSITGLTDNLFYTVHVCEYTGGPGAEKYFAASATNNPETTVAVVAPDLQANSIIFSNIYSTILTLNWTNGNGFNRAVFAKQASIGSTAPTDNTTYTANSTFGSGTQIGSTGWYCVYNGTGSNVTVSGLSSNTDYIFQVFEYYNTAGNELYLTSPASNNPNSQATNSTTTPVPNYALTFDGSNDYVNIPASSSLNMSSSSFTIETWIRSDATYSGWKVILEHGASWATGAYGFHSNGSNHLKVDFYGRAGTPVEVSVTTDWTDGKWHHFAGVFDNTANNLMLYMDGKKVSEATETGQPGSATVPLYIDGRGGSTLFINADMDEVRVWNVARTEAQIQANMCKKLAGSETGLMAYYKMTDGSGTTLTDNSSNSNNGTLTNMDDANWITSGAAIGDESISDYSTPSSLNLASADGDDVTINTISGTPDGVQLYLVNGASMVNTPPENMTKLYNSHYFGVFIPGGTSPTYTLTYNYDGNPAVVNEDILDLAKRDNNASTEWTQANATLNTTANTLTLTNQSGTEYILGQKVVLDENYALSFDGVTNYVQTSVNSALNMGNSNFTVEMWIKSSSAHSSWVVPIEYGAWEAGAYQFASLNSNTMKISFYGSSSGGASYTYDWTDGNWHHFAGVFNNTENKLMLYLDGDLVSEVTENNAPASVDRSLYLGSRSGSSLFLNADMDEIRIWNVARTTEEIQANMYDQLSGNETGLAAYYQMSDGTGTTLTDNKTGGTATGFIHGATWATPGAPPVLIWMGSNNASWTNTTNWKNSTVPEKTYHVIIPQGLSNYPVLSSGSQATCGPLKVESGASLTINSGGSLITTGTITNNGTITMQQTLTGAAQAWHMVSGPAVADISDNGWIPGDNDDFYAWKETDPGTWVNYKNTTTSPTFSEVNGSDNFVAGNGYLAAYNSLNPAKSIVGTPNTGDVTLTLKNSGSKSWTYTSGWNLLGNPYPAAIDWNLATRTQFQDNFAYIYDPNRGGGEGYVSVDGGSASAYIAPFQGFMVVAAIASNNQTFTFTNAMRDHGGSFMKNQTATEGLMVRLSHGNWYDEATIRLREESNHTRDRQDALKLFSFNPAVPQLYSQSSDVVSLAINSIPGAEAGEPIALGMLLPGEGLFTLSLQQTDETMAANGLYLEDRLTGIFHKLSDQPFQFAAEQGSLDDRFLLHFGVVGVEESTPGQMILVWQQNNQIYLKGAENYREVGLFDLQGRLLQRTSLSGNNLQSPQATGLYIIRLLGNDRAVSKKLFIN